MRLQTVWDNRQTDIRRLTELNRQERSDWQTQQTRETDKAGQKHTEQTDRIRQKD